MSSPQQRKDNTQQDTMEISLMDENIVVKSQKQDFTSTKKGKGLIVAGITGAFLAGMGLADYATQKTSSYSNFVNKITSNLSMQSTEKYIPNINQITYGFNLIKANPVNMDQNNFYTGTTGTPVFNITYSNGEQMDGYNIPDGYTFEFTGGENCDLDQTEDTFTGMSSYVEWLSQIVTYNTQSPFGFGFGANLTTKNYRDLFYNKHAAVKVSSRVCEVYSTSVSAFALPAPSNSFINALNVLAASQMTDANLQSFYDSVGTHFQQTTGMGAAQYESQILSDLDMAVYEVHMNYYKQSSSSDKDKYINDDKPYVSNLDKKSANNYQQEQKNTDYNADSMVVGNNPQGFTSSQQWVQASAMDPVPIKFTVTPIYVLLSSSWLMEQYPQQNLSAETIKSISAALEAYAPKYCADIVKDMQVDDQVSFCKKPEPDPVYGFGPSVTSYIQQNIGGYWGPILMPPQSAYSTWYMMAEQGNNFLQGICVENAAHGRDCYPNKSNGFLEHPKHGVTVDGPMVGINLLINNGNYNGNDQIHDVQFVYIGQNGKQAKTQWAFNYELDLKSDYDNNDSSTAAEQNEENYLEDMWEIVSYTVDDGYIIGLTGLWCDDWVIYNLASFNVVYDQNKVK